MVQSRPQIAPDLASKEAELAFCALHVPDRKHTPQGSHLRAAGKCLQWAAWIGPVRERVQRS